MTLSVINPYDQSVYRTLSFDTPAEVEAKVQAAKAVAENWRKVPLAERIGTVRNALDYFRTHEAAIAESITGQMGKPITASHNEIGALFERAGHMLSIAEDILAPGILPPKDHLHRRIEREPLGVVLNIAAWNYPLLIAVNGVVPALVAGNSALLKHSAKTPLCGEHFQAAFRFIDVGLELGGQGPGRCGRGCRSGVYRAPCSGRGPLQCRPVLPRGGQ